MKRFHSITFRITGLMFLSIATTVFILVYLANVQMNELFQEYLSLQHMEVHSAANGHLMNGMLTFGPQEMKFLESVHESLIWVGGAILGIGLIASYCVARSITVPLHRLGGVAAQLEQGNLGETVEVEKDDEIGQLAAIFNSMSRRLEQNEKLRQQLLANIAHELRTPLAIIQGNLEGMMDEVIETDKVQLASLHEEAVRLNRLIKDLRDLSLAEAQQLNLEKYPTDINYLLSSTVQKLRPMAENKQIQIFYETNEKLPEITVDADRISQVLNNLFVNAIRYSSVQGWVRADTSLQQKEGRQWICISIQDNGCGISAEDIPYVFDHFYRGEKSRDRKSGGSGIGLAIVKQLVELHGGKVLIESQLNVGSTFQVWLPVLAPA